MKRKVVVLGVVSVMTALLCGCGGDFPNLTEEQETIVGEYAAITLLKYDASNRSRLVKLDIEEASEETKTEPEPESTETYVEPEPEEPSMPEETPVVEIEETTPAVSSLEEFYDFPEGLALVYAGEEVTQSYSSEDNDYFSLDATPGKSLLVLKFFLQNTSGVDQTVDLLNREDNYRITVNEDYTRTALTTMLYNDLSVYKGTVEEGDSVEVVLLMELDLEQAQNLTSIALSLKNESKTYTIQLF